MLAKPDDALHPHSRHIGLPRFRLRGSLFLARPLQFRAIAVFFVGHEELQGSQQRGQEPAVSGSARSSFIPEAFAQVGGGWRGTPACPRFSSSAVIQYGPMASPQQLALDQIKLSMARTNDLFNTEVVGNRNFAALDDIYTSDARILPPGAPMISGREAIKKFWSDFVQSANAKSAVLASMDITPAADGVVEIGRATLSIEPQGQPATQIEVKYVVFWRQENERWKWHVDIWNQNT
jgi:ketosteroid isomerase-like protein